ncbi:hypothetical protein EMIHUDRAFT_441490 [Emiliania huxleyi CCMP1516]|uniref:Steroid 5-alpha reductase C-terminal domain-containing protein n=2 Tax=Emiliania huxleyi TaxID=2903 RepID=A0A0D3KD12_EMIH1|nr:hypothetical protein EMIHUDRAFT_444641 [Emiliania huxleyi CCMP1516]XP_005786076.1 hypothetical protein EMIHUDRAFT_441490 [Emiliania huxleyi CCMP1516]EOD20752.1 hypothetical protein EMIHUDRAFT_444641 [Emiliania huxleyi CCMP1516]EOD33647.1 hypothetical protein EMIHUDRAFT_441490 [Emiliania huxleyi CCMP1516]|eukprot:XP_005773181.1 hypothetical protein EMIHUDRAFT_444641 [Emiliania huxleyi CCMP1516]
MLPRSLLLLSLASADAFAAARPHLGLPPRPAARPVHVLRGGGAALQASLAGALAGGMALPTATGIAAACGTLCYIRQAYIFSLSYGLSMLGIGGAVLLAAPAPRSPLLAAHAGLVAAYGARLFAFLLWRQKFQPAYDGEARLKPLDKTPRLQRTPILLSTALFYSLLASPLLFHLQAAPLAGASAAVAGVSAAGAAVAAAGLVYEAVADQQKSRFKMALRAGGAKDRLYMGGLYAQSRHANYLGELVFWTGSFLAGAPSIAAAAGLPLWARALRLVAASLGLAGIFFIMTSATKRLEGKQREKYGAEAEYAEYLASTNALLPKF